MEKIKALATKRIYGVPVLVFVAVFFLGILYYAIKLPPAEDTSVVTDADAPEGDGTGDTSQPVFSATPTIMQPSGPSVSATPMADTNVLYGRRALEWLIANGASYSDASAMVSKWLDGESLTADEDKLRAKVIAHFGIPPEDVAFAAVTPATSTVSATPAANGESTYPNNAAWGSAARDYLQGSAGASVATTTATLSEYLEERPASYRYHGVLRDMAIAHLGLPPNPPNIPEGNPYDMPGQGGVEPPANWDWTPPAVIPPTPGPSSATPRAAKQGTPPLVHVVRGNGDTSYRELGLLYFNSTAFDLIQRMKAQDRNIGKDGPFAVGTHIKIPSQDAHYFVATNNVRTATAIASKNGITTQALKIMNPQTNFPVAVGTRIQVG
jgi:hypothetical protein